MKIEETIEGGILFKRIIYEDSDKRTEEEKNSLLEICNICEFKQNDSCGKCGCLLQTRLQMKEITCPINKW